MQETRIIRGSCRPHETIEEKEERKKQDLLMFLSQYNCLIILFSIGVYVEIINDLSVRQYYVYYLICSERERVINFLF